MSEQSAERNLGDYHRLAESESRRVAIDLLRLVVIAVSLIAIALSLAGQEANYREARAEALSNSSVVANLRDLHLSINAFSTVLWLQVLLGSLVFFAVAAIIARRRPRQPAALLSVLLLVSIGAVIPSSIHALGWSVASVAWFDDVLHATTYESIFLVFLLFPDGRFVPNWTRWPAFASLVILVPPALPLDARLTGSAAYQTGSMVVVGSLLLCGALAQIHRYRHNSDMTARRQVKWVTMAVSAAFVGTGTLQLLSIAVEDRSGAAVSELVISTGRGMFVLLIPLSFAVAILRYHLWDIDLFINRALVYGSLTAILTGLFAALVGLFERFFQSELGGSGNLAYALSTLVVAASFTPIKNGVQAVVDRRFRPVPAHHALLATTAGPVEFNHPSDPGYDHGEVLRELAALRAELAPRAEGERELREHIARLESQSGSAQDGDDGRGPDTDRQH